VVLNLRQPILSGDLILPGRLGEDQSTKSSPINLERNIGATEGERSGLSGTIDDLRLPCWSSRTCAALSVYGVTRYRQEHTQGWLPLSYSMGTAQPLKPCREYAQAQTIGWRKLGRLDASGEANTIKARIPKGIPDPAQSECPL
jgi:hypothetical protein